MALPETTAGRYVLVKVETATPGTYATICGFKDRSLKASRPSVDTSVQNCDDPDEIVVDRDVGPISYEISGSGVASKAGLVTLATWFESGEAKSVKVESNSGAGWTTWTGDALLTNYELGGQIEGEKASITATIVSTGAWARTTNS